jgi:signal transduction histidine kinase
MLAFVEKAEVLAELEALRERLAHAEASERRRIGRELHDSTSQLLVAAQLSMAVVERRTLLTPEARAALADARRSIAGAQAEIRAFAFLLHPPALQTQGLARCLRAFGSGFAHRTDLAITVKVGRNVPRLADPLELALYRIAQEGLMNVYRHAQATTTSIRLRREDSGILLEIEDDGVGLRGPLDRSRGVGIAGMQARMTQVGGTLSFETERKGLLVRAAAPITPRLHA